MHIKVNSLEEALVTLGDELLCNSTPRETRGFRCFEYPEPVMVTINDPTQRYIYNKERGWNKHLGFAESLWLLNGVNSMDMVGKVVKNLYNFSDDGQFMRAGYGPRIRSFSGAGGDYTNEDPDLIYVQNQCGVVVDQLKYTIELLHKDINTRQASITIHDPAKDCFNSDGTIKTTKDQPCTRLLQFMVVDGKLDMTTYMRSNDFLWGFSAVNIFNFTFMQEIVANMIGVKVGRYHHVMNNIHYYENFRDKIKGIVNIKPVTLPTFRYEFKTSNFNKFDVLLKKAYREAMLCSHNKNPYYELQLTGEDILDDALKSISQRFQGQREFNSSFTNPLINRLFDGK